MEYNKKKCYCWLEAGECYCEAYNHYIQQHDARTTREDRVDSET